MKTQQCTISRLRNNNRGKPFPHHPHETRKRPGSRSAQRLLFLHHDRAPFDVLIGMFYDDKSMRRPTLAILPTDPAIEDRWPLILSADDEKQFLRIIKS
jgi:hypothetical protein